MVIYKEVLLGVCVCMYVFITKLKRFRQYALKKIDF